MYTGSRRIGQNENPLKTGEPMQPIVRVLKKFRADAILALYTMAAIPLSAQTFTTLHSFDNSDGAYPEAGLVQATNGAFYGTTQGGGANGLGTIFNMTPNGTVTALYSFCSQSGCSDGVYPEAGLIQAANGDFYGTTTNGGTDGNGTIFKITPSGSLATLYRFSQGGPTDGTVPYAGLVQATNRYLYGTTWIGGINGEGAVFKISPSGTLTTLYAFCSQSACADGSHPSAGLVQSTNGTLYGTTTGGGASGMGTVFKITPSGALTTIYSFCSQSGCPDGSMPYGGLTLASNEDLYGTTNAGGAHCAPYGCGTVFRITPGGTLTTLYRFCSKTGCTDGSAPFSGLIQATDGNFYGTTSLGGANSAGTIFKITPAGSLTELYPFCSQSGCIDGKGPYTALGSAGSFSCPCSSGCSSCDLPSSTSSARADFAIGPAAVSGITPVLASARARAASKTSTLDLGDSLSGGTRWIGEQRWSFSSRSAESTSLAWERFPESPRS